MKVEGIKPDIVTYNALLLAASRAGLSLHAWAIFDDMELMGIRPDPTSFYHLLNVTRNICQFMAFTEFLILFYFHRRSDRRSQPTCGESWGK
jgi:pentatricopeptide repeat protein